MILSFIFLFYVDAYDDQTTLLDLSNTVSENVNQQKLKEVSNIKIHFTIFTSSS